jgi:hypothetical protein
VQRSLNCAILSAIDALNPHVMIADWSGYVAYKSETSCKDMDNEDIDDGEDDDDDEDGNLVLAIVGLSTKG